MGDARHRAFICHQETKKRLRLKEAEEPTAFARASFFHLFFFSPATEMKTTQFMTLIATVTLFSLAYLMNIAFMTGGVTRTQTPS